MLTLGDRHPESRLAPADRTQYYRWLVFMTNTVQTAFLRFFYPSGTAPASSVRSPRPSCRSCSRSWIVLSRAAKWLVADHRTGADLYLFMLRGGAAAWIPRPGTGQICEPTSNEPWPSRACAGWSRSRASTCRPGRSRNRPSRSPIRSNPARDCHAVSVSVRQDNGGGVTVLRGVWLGLWHEAL